MNTPLIHAGLALRQRYQERQALLLSIALPLLFGALITLVMGEGATPRGTVLVVDHDESLVSDLLGSGFGQGDVADMLSVRQADSEDEAMASVRAGNVSAVVIIPQGFSQALINGDPTELRVVRNPAQRIVPGIVEESLSMLVEAVHYLRLLLGDEIDAIVEQAKDGQAPDSAFVAEVSLRIADRIESVDSLLFPPKLDITVLETGSEAAASPDVAGLFFPSVLIMGLLFISQLLAGDLWREAEAGTLRRVAISVQGMSGWLPGRLLAALPILAGAALVFSLAAFLWHGWPAWRLPVVVAWAVCVALPLLALMLLVASLAPSRRGADVMTTMVLFPMLIIGGGLFPLDAMPAWLSAIGQWLPNGMASRALTDWLLGSADAMVMLRNAALSVAMALVLLALLQLRLPVMARRSNS